MRVWWQINSCVEANDQEEEVEGGLDGDRCDALSSVMGARSPLAGGGTQKHKSWGEGQSAVRGDTHVAVCPAHYAGQRQLLLGRTDETEIWNGRLSPVSFTNPLASGIAQ